MHNSVVNEPAFKTLWMVWRISNGSLPLTWSSSEIMNSSMDSSIRWYTTWNDDFHSLLSPLPRVPRAVKKLAFCLNSWKSSYFIHAVLQAKKSASNHQCIVSVTHHINNRDSFSYQNIKNMFFSNSMFCFPYSFYSPLQWQTHVTMVNISRQRRNPQLIHHVCNEIRTEAMICQCSEAYTLPTFYEQIQPTRSAKLTHVTLISTFLHK